MTIFPTKDQLLQTFLSYSNWEEKYLYIMDLGNLLPEFPKYYRTHQYLVAECQSYTWIAVIKNTPDSDYKKQKFVSFYGDSESTIIKGIIVIIFSLYQNLDMHSIIELDINSFLNQLQLTQNLTIARSQGIQSILHSIYMQINTLIY